MHHNATISSINSVADSTASNHSAASFFKGIATNPIVGFWIGFIGIILAVIFYIKSRKLKRPIYWMRTFEILKGEEKFPKLSIAYESETINTVSLTKIAFLNAGNETIDSGDIAPKNPLRVEIGGSFKILDKSIVYHKNEANNFKLQETEEKNILKIDFDYLDKDEGAIFQIIHDGASADAINIRGSIKGVPHILRFKKKNYLNDSVLLIGGIIAALAGIAISKHFNLALFWEYLIMLVIAVFIGIIFGLISSKLPKGVFQNYDNRM